MLAKWENGAIDVDIPENLNMESPTVTLIYDEQGKLLWAQRDVPWLAKRIQPEWLKRNGFHEIEADVDSSSMLLRNNHEIQEQLDAIREQGDDSEMTHSVAINLYPATSKMPQLSIVVVDTIPVELKRSYMVWSWFIYVLAANLLLVIPCCGSPPGGACAHRVAGQRGARTGGTSPRKAQSQHHPRADPAGQQPQPPASQRARTL
jgi:two-component system sensor histidine kinase PhoQ